MKHVGQCWGGNSHEEQNCLLIWICSTTLPKSVLSGLWLSLRHIKHFSSLFQYSTGSCCVEKCYLMSIVCSVCLLEKEQLLTPQWGGPFQVLLTTEWALGTAEWEWTHGKRMKGPGKEPKE